LAASSSLPVDISPRRSCDRGRGRLSTYDKSIRLLGGSSKPPGQIKGDADSWPVFRVRRVVSTARHQFLSHTDTQDKRIARSGMRHVAGEDRTRRPATAGARPRIDAIFRRRSASMFSFSAWPHRPGLINYRLTIWFGRGWYERMQVGCTRFQAVSSTIKTFCSEYLPFRGRLLRARRYACPADFAYSGGTSRLAFSVISALSTECIVAYILSVMQPPLFAFD